MNIYRLYACRIRLGFILLFLFAFLAVPCLAAGEFQLISTSQEQQLGRETAIKVEAKYGVYKNPAWDSRINTMGRRLAERSDRPGLPYTFKVLNTKMVNAFALPGGYVYVTRGLMDSGISEMELAGVLGHEIAHAAKRHSMRQLERSLGVTVLLQILTKGQSGAAELSTQVVQLLLERGYSREYEFEADNAGAFYSWKAGYNPWGLVFFLDRLLKMQKGESSGSVAQWFSTHPDTKDRISRLEVQMKDLKEPRPETPKDRVNSTGWPSSQGRTVTPRKGTYNP
jgi:predicted Zn-dependent protease